MMSYKTYKNENVFCLMMLCKCGLCHHAVCVCVSVCVSITFVDSVKTNKRIFKICWPSGSHTILVFPYQTSWQYSDAWPPPQRLACAADISKAFDKILFSLNWCKSGPPGTYCAYLKIGLSYGYAKRVLHWVTVVSWVFSVDCHVIGRNIVAVSVCTVHVDNIVATISLADVAVLLT